MCDVTNLISGILWTNILLSFLFSFVSLISLFGKCIQIKQYTYATEDDDDNYYFT